MKCKILCHTIHTECPERSIDIIIGKQMAKDYVKRFCNERSDFLSEFITGHPLNGMFLCKEGNTYLMCLPEEFNAETVYHECFHACMRIWYDAGANLEFPQNDEVITYMQGTMVKKIEELYNAHKE